MIKAYKFQQLALTTIFGIAITSYTPACQAAPGSEQFDSEKTRLEVVTLLDNLDSPWGMAFLPDRTLLITEKSGKLKHYNPATGETKTIRNTPPTKVIGQGGLMAVLPHPDFTNNRWVYLSYSAAQEKLAATRVARAQLIDDQLENLQVLFTAQPAVKSGAHFGAAMAFDQQGYLYISSGERHSRPLVQDLSTHIGKIARLHDDGSIPTDNPYLNNPDALPEIFSIGHRNPQGMAIEPQTGKVWSVEHGPRGGDEVNLIHRGKNYGWPVVSYGKEYISRRQIGEGKSKPGIEEPIHYYVPSIAPSGMLFYQGEAFPEWQGNLLIGALALRHLNRLEIRNGQVVHEERLLEEFSHRIRNLAEAPDGTLYLLTDNGKLIRLKPLTE